MEEEKEFKVNGVWMTEKEAKRIAFGIPNISVFIKHNDKLLELTSYDIWDTSAHQWK